MSSREYWTEKTVSWKYIGVGLAVWIFALATLLLTEATLYLKLMAVASGEGNPLP